MTTSPRIIDGIAIEPLWFASNDLPKIEAALTDITALMDAFFWTFSPQGHAFWKRQVEAGALLPAGRAILEATLEARRAGK